MSVVNLHHLKPGWESDPQYVYVGRAGHGRDGYFGNPFRGPRGTAVDYFVDYADVRIAKDPEYRDRVKGLYGKTLVCFCDPEPCHADYLEYLADHLHEGDLDE